MLRTIGVLVAVLTLGPVSLFAQTTTGTLRGTVRDTSGAVLPGATVEVTGAAGTQSVVADANGLFRFAALTPGVYSLKASSRGSGSVAYRRGVSYQNTAVGKDLGTDTLSAPGQLKARLVYIIRDLDGA